jgi:hypothetical protein
MKKIEADACPAVQGLGEIFCQAIYMFIIRTKRSRVFYSICGLLASFMIQE